MIYYFTSYSKYAEELGLIRYPAAEAKSAYVLSCLKKIGDVTTVCFVDIAPGKFRFFPGAKKDLDGKETHIIFPSVSPEHRLLRGVNRVIQRIKTVSLLLFRAKADDHVVVYHDLRILPALMFVKKLKKFNLILELEEIYSDITNDDQFKCKELKLLDVSDAYIFPTQLLNETLNKQDKPAVIVHGTYQMEQNRGSNFLDGKIHVVYAGTLEPWKGATAAAASAANLPENYHVHILGFGTNQQINDMQELVRKYSVSGHASVTYDGLLSGEDYIRFIQSCDIGLSTQNPDAAFNATSFPSKILSYMANGLRVVSIRIAAVECSDVGDMITYYDEQSPENIAEAIMRVDMLHPYDSRKRISELDAKVKTEIRELLEQL